MAAPTIKDAVHAHYVDLAERIWPAAPSACVVFPVADRSWFVLQTKLRGEDRVRDSLQGIGFQIYIPVMRKDVQNPKSKKWTTREFKLFNRYLFARLPTNPQKWPPVKNIEEYDCALGANGKPLPIADGEIERFRAAERDLLFDDTEEAKIKRKEIGRTQRETTAMRFKPGSLIRARSGPFAGFSGTVKNVNGRGAVEAMLDIFARLTPVEFDPSQLESIR